ncbi:AAA family ATPase [Albimonas pacifica]|uniref:Pilus assembly protein CpaE n=1 Tax=Albimonas pacifica TaxID=1114924 RepID=A0A1I3N2N2_9RHOB|nr:AAA family ATPase [Albimonas pacifica]SFJ03451.1 pilus assembly protein CpaE [Albimonas pacifica]
MILKRGGQAADMMVVAENLDAFDGLRRELEAEFPDGGWTAVTLRGLRKALDAQPPAYVLLAVDATDMGRIDELVQLIALGRGRGSSMVLLVQDLPPMAMHRMMRAGAEDFLPVPLPAGALAESLAALGDGRGDGDSREARNGLIYPVYGVAGGVGATTFAVNLAWEIAHEARKTGLKIAILDLDFQYGSVATYLDMPRRDSVFELLTGIDRADPNGFAAALEDRGKRISVLTAPADALPLNIVSPPDVEKLLGFARDSFDVVILDLPTTLTEWTETALSAAQRFWAVMEIDMRSAQNMLRFLRALQAEDLPFDKVDYVMNRVPGFGDFGARGRVKKMAETLGIEYGVLLPDGGKAVIQACDHGSPLAEFASGNALRKEIRKTARAVLEEVQASRAAPA